MGKPPNSHPKFVFNRTEVQTYDVSLYLIFSQFTPVPTSLERIGVDSQNQVYWYDGGMFIGAACDLRLCHVNDC